LNNDGYILLKEQLPILESLMLCANNKWIPILVGDAGVGKTALVECLAQLSGQHLQCITLSGSSDTSDLLGSFEQSDVWQRIMFICYRESYQ
jgi:midasin